MFLRSGLAAADPPAGEVVSGTQPPAHVSARLGRTTHPLLQARDDGPHQHPRGATRPPDGSRRSHTATAPRRNPSDLPRRVEQHLDGAAQLRGGKVQRGQGPQPFPARRTRPASPPLPDPRPLTPGCRKSSFRASRGANAMGCSPPSRPPQRTRTSSASRAYVRGLGDVEQRHPRGGAQGSPPGARQFRSGIPAAPPPGERPDSPGVLSVGPPPVGIYREPVSGRVGELVDECAGSRGAGTHRPGCDPAMKAVVSLLVVSDRSAAGPGRP